MKNKILFLITVFITNAAFCQYTAIPDPNFEAFLEANGMGDGIDNNGLVLTENINTVITLDLPSFAGITDLTGIEDFVAVEFLNFSFNQVISINLSQNLNLKIFGCAFNNISSLDLSNNTQLEWVAAMGNPSLSSLLLNSASLHTLEVFECNLSVLDLSQCPNLTFIDCHSNQLSILNITQCTSLTEVIAWSNLLTTLDTSQNNMLEHLSLASNMFTTINLFNNTELRIISLSNNTNLTNLDISNNSSLTSVACSSNPNLEFIDIRNGNNENINQFSAGNNNSLSCVFVDDASASYLDDWTVGNNTVFVNDESECEELNTATFNENIFRMYPNPTHDFITVSIIYSATYTLINANGKQLKTGMLTEGLNKISLSNLSSGLYFLKIYTVSGVATKKIIKE